MFRGALFVIVIIATGDSVGSVARWTWRCSTSFQVITCHSVPSRGYSKLHYIWIWNKVVKETSVS